MNGFHKSGFTLIELIIGLAILGLLAAVAIPNIKNFIKKDEQQVFFNDLNSLTSNALDNAIISDKTNRIVFDFVNKKIFIEQELDKKLPTGQIGYESISSKYVQAEFDYSKFNFEFKNFFIDTKDEMSLSAGQIKKEKVWFFISSDGTAQPVVINLIEVNENLPENERQFSLVLNPFTVQFKKYEKFMQPT